MADPQCRRDLRGGTVPVIAGPLRALALFAAAVAGESAASEVRRRNAPPACRSRKGRVPAQNAVSSPPQPKEEGIFESATNPNAS